MRDSVRSKVHFQISTAWTELEVSVLQVHAQHLAFKLVAIELIGVDVGKFADVRLAIVLVTIIRVTRRFPIKAQVVFEIVLLQQVFFEIEYSGVIVGGELYGCLAHLLLGRRKFSAAIDQENSLVRVEKKL